MLRSRKAPVWATASVLEPLCARSRTLVTCRSFRPPHPGQRTCPAMVKPRAVVSASSWARTASSASLTAASWARRSSSAFIGTSYDANYSSPQVGDQRGARAFLTDFDRLAPLDVSPSEGRDPTEV